MNFVLIVLGVLAGLVVLFIIYRYAKVQHQNKKINDLQWERVRPLHEKLNRNQDITPTDILPFAENVLSRELAFALLSSADKKDLFPEEYNTLIKGAESKLANWLKFPTELDACPDEMEHLKRVSIDFDGQHNYSHYEVFRFRINATHWAAKYDWMLGVVGPYFDDSKPYSAAMATFSRLTPESKISVEEEARWVHENISLRR